MDIQEIKEFFNAKIDPIQSDIKELKESQQCVLEKVMEIAKIQERHNVEIEETRKDVIECKFNVDNCYDQFNEIREKKEGKKWDVFKMIFSAIIGGFLTIIVGLFLRHF